MRMTQIFGLTEEAIDFINQNCRKVPDVVCPHCQGTVSEKNDAKPYLDASNLGMFNDGPQLMEYTLKDGRILQEVEQETVWSSGPCIFSALKDQTAGEILFKWSKEEIEKC